MFQLVIAIFFMIIMWTILITFLPVLGMIMLLFGGAICFLGGAMSAATKPY